MKPEVLTFAEECSRDKKYMAALRAIPRPTGVGDLERFRDGYREAYCQRYPYMREVFAEVDNNQQKETKHNDKENNNTYIFGTTTTVS